MIRQKQNSEKEKNELKIELEDVSQSLQSVTTAKINFEKQCKIMEDNIYEATQREKELARNIQEGNAVKDRLQSDNVDQLRQIDEKDGAIKNLIKLKNTQAQELDLIRSDLAEEERAKQHWPKGSRQRKKKSICSEISAKPKFPQKLIFKEAYPAQMRKWLLGVQNMSKMLFSELRSLKKRKNDLLKNSSLRKKRFDHNILN